jgi:hypothetical protein
MLNTNTVQVVDSEACAYWTAAWKVNSSKHCDRPTEGGLLSVELLMSNHDEKFELGSGCTREYHTL